jgi:hypothetical protein
MYNHNSKQRPIFSLRRFIFRDNATFVYLVLTVLGLPFWPYDLAIVPIFAFLFIRRIRLVRSAFLQGSRVKATLTWKMRKRRNWAIYYTYPAGGAVQRDGNLVMGFSVPVEVGEELDVMVHPQKPDKAFIVKLYEKPKSTVN